jgi:hypothetical protein
MNSVSKKEQIGQSIISIFILLKKIQTNPENYFENEAITKSLRNQSNLCKLYYTFMSDGCEHHIFPLSLNTIKHKLSNSDIPGTFEELNTLRLLALDSIRNYRSPQKNVKKRNKSGLEDTIRELNASVASLHSTNMVLLQAIVTSINDLKTIKDTPNTGLRQKRIDDALQRITLILSINPTPYNDVTSAYPLKNLRLITNDQNKTLDQ